METKEQLVNNIKEWIKIDTEISQLKSEIKEKNNKANLCAIAKRITLTGV